jgi:membrane-associated phospholipid phosphatase
MVTSPPAAVLVGYRVPGPHDAAAVGRVLARRLVVASVAAVVCAALCYVLMVRTSLGQRFDEAAFVAARTQSGTVAAVDSGELHRITADSLAVVLLVMVGIGILRRRVRLGLGAAFAAGIAVVVTDGLKSHVLTRPDLTGRGSYVIGNTYPSGHTAAAVACAMALVLVSPPRWRGVAAVVAGGYGWVTAAQVQTAGWHRPSDAVGAAFLAFAAVTAVAAVLVANRPEVRIRGGRHRPALGLLAVVGLVEGAVCLRGLIDVVRYLHAHAEGVRVSAGIRQEAYTSGLSVTVVVVVTLLAGLLVLIGRIDIGRR